MITVILMHWYQQIRCITQQYSSTLNYNMLWISCMYASYQAYCYRLYRKQYTSLYKSAVLYSMDFLGRCITHIGSNPNNASGWWAYRGAEPCLLFGLCSVKVNILVQNTSTFLCRFLMGTCSKMLLYTSELSWVWSFIIFSPQSFKILLCFTDLCP